MNKKIDKFTIEGKAIFIVIVSHYLFVSVYLHEVRPVSS